MSASRYTLGGLEAGGFASPHGALSGELLDVIVGEHSRALVRGFLVTHGPALSRWSAGVHEVLEGFAGDGASFDVAWNISFGGIAAARREPWGVAPQVAATQLALHLHDQGALGAWECRLDEPRRLRYGAWLAPPADRLAVRRDAHGLDVRASLDGRPAGEPQPLAVIDTLTVLTAEAAPPLARVPGPDGGWERLPAPVPAVSGEMWAACDAALAMLGRHAPEYRDWILQIVRWLVPLTPVEGVQISTSAELQPGTVWMSAHPRPAEIAEMLVHESAHQYMHVLTRLGPMDDGSDKTLYYSPLKGTHRPIRGIIAAYHAVANILLWTHAALASDVDDAEYFVANAENLPDKLAMLDEALSTTHGLTALGRLVYEPLRDRVGVLSAAAPAG